MTVYFLSSPNIAVCDLVYQGIHTAGDGTFGQVDVGFVAQGEEALGGGGA